MKPLKRGRSQVLFRYLPGSVFMEDNKWYKVDELKLKKLNENTTHLLQQVKKFIKDWTINRELKNDLFPKQDELYYFAEIEEVIYNLFPLVFYCNICENVHEYNSINEIQDKNPELKCQFCKKGILKQYPYALIHPNGDIKSINVVGNKGAKNWREKYKGVKMRDTRRFTTASWYNSITNTPLSTSLGTKVTTLPVTEDMKKNRKIYLGGTHLSDGDIHYPALKSVVNLQQETLVERQKLEDFPFIQLAAMLNLSSIKTGDFSENYRNTKSNNNLQNLLESAKNESDRAVLLKILKESGMDKEINEVNFKDEVKRLFGEINEEIVVNDRLLHEFVFSWFENGGKDIEKKIQEAKDMNDTIQETTLINAKRELNNLGFSSALLLEKFPIITMGIGFTRKYYDKSKAILNPFTQKIGNKKYAVIPVLKNENEAIIFKLDPLRVLGWLVINNLLAVEDFPKSKEEAHALIYKNLLLGSIEPEELSNIDPAKIENNNLLLASVLTFQLIHTLLHSLLQAGKSVIGLDVDSMSEYIFPSALSGAIYVSKLQGGGMGTLIAAFDNDLERWLRNTYDKSQTCLYDPICKGQHGACHACSYLKFSCQYFNRSLSRNLLIGDNSIKGYYSKELDEFLKINS
ncbi:hypothetical protein [Parageobacillus thermoglucosidasius]|uniref:hypothetical protein n=1 Tax=Parageobacillus thermoglucosidasius TaxID=1426 RepID=UPI0021AB25D7|nr:hypothetical protein [Parageobacillus thermoglucosidasius]